MDGESPAVVSTSQKGGQSVLLLCHVSSFLTEIQLVQAQNLLLLRHFTRGDAANQQYCRSTTSAWGQTRAQATTDLAGLAERQSTAAQMTKGQPST